MNDLGYIYFVADGAAVKIGFSLSPKGRIATLQTATHAKLQILAVIRGTRQEEMDLHHRFAEKRICGEWFRADEELNCYIGALADAGDLDSAKSGGLSKMIAIRVPREDYEALVRLARAARRNVSQYIRILIEKRIASKSKRAAA